MIIDNENEMNLIREKLEFYKNNKTMVHIELKDKRFLNARIIDKDKNSNNVYIINERIFGIMHLFVREVYRISEFVEVEK